jgi:lectin-like protein
MKNIIAQSIVVIALALTLPASAAIITGPVNNPANGHDYYLLSANSWTASEAEAERLGGTLAVIKNVGEQEWVFSTFGGYGGTNRNLWIGMYRRYPGGPFTWVTDAAGSYLNWAPGQPDNAGNESYVQMFGPREDRITGTWNDLADVPSLEGTPNCGVVEVPAKTAKSLSEKEKSFIGTWYASGEVDHPCWISGTEDKMFQIFDGRACRLIYTAEGSLLVLTPQHGIYGDMAGDKILWSNGTWWSRKPILYDSAAGVNSVKVQGLDRAAGKHYDSPQLRGGGQ